MSTPARKATLDEVERKARADLAKGGQEIVVDWAFRHARAVVRLAAAEQAWRALDSDRYRLQLDYSNGAKDEYDALTLCTQSLHAAAGDLAEARAIEVACGHVLRLAEKGIGRVQVGAPATKKAA